MATDIQTVQFICDQAGLGARLSYKRMFGEFGLYLDEKIIALVCDDELFLKPTPEGKAILGTPLEKAPFPGAKAYYQIDHALDERDLLQTLLIETARALPPPKPKAAKKTKTK